MNLLRKMWLKFPGTYYQITPIVTTASDTVITTATLRFTVPSLRQRTLSRFRSWWRMRAGSL